MKQVKLWVIVLCVVMAIAVAAGASVGCFLWGKSSGYDIGYDEGYTSGYDSGHSVGYTAGYDDGYATIPEEAKLYLELMALWAEGTAVATETGEAFIDIGTTVAMERVLEDIDNDALSDAWRAYTYSQWYEYDYYWVRFLDTLAEELRSYLE